LRRPHLEVEELLFLWNNIHGNFSFSISNKARSKKIAEKLWGRKLLFFRMISTGKFLLNISNEACSKRD
jgi:hypothetical protein